MPIELFDRARLEAAEDVLLAPYAIKARDSGGRAFPEPEHEFRTAFQRDRDRIIHCDSFRRLEYKTQVFVNHEGDHYRTRLTHTIEVAHVALAVGRVLRLSPDLIECIALAHDLGHTPFGHAGEEALNACMREHGGFEHNRQSLRIVEALERYYPGFDGLNLTREVREGLIKHRRLAAGEKTGVLPPSLEARLVDLSDRVAYDCSDMDDGLRSGILKLEEVRDLEIWRRAEVVARETFGAIPPELVARQGVRCLKNVLVTDLIITSGARIREADPPSSEVARRSADPAVGPGGVKPALIGFSDDIIPLVAALDVYLRDHFYRHYRVLRAQAKAQRVVTDLWVEYVRDPRILPTHVFKRIGDISPQQVACDYVAGMTDRFAIEEYARLFDPASRA